MLSPKMVPLATVFSTSGPTQVVLKRWSVCRETLTWFQQLVSVVLPDAFATLGNHRNHQRLPNHKEPAYVQGSARQCFACRGTDLMKKIFLRWFGSTKTAVGRHSSCVLSPGRSISAIFGCSCICESRRDILMMGSVMKEGQQFMVRVGSKKNRGLMLFDRTSWQIDQNVCPFSQLSLSSLQNLQ